MRRSPVVVLALTAATALAACSSGSGASPTGSASPSVSATASTSSASPPSSPSARPTYPVSSATVWLCRPGLPASPCETTLTTTVVARDGSRTTQPFVPATDPLFDCFYVYPTVSTATTRNAPKESAPEIVRVVRAQAALFGRVCRLYAPIYRQVTLRGLATGGYTDPTARAMAQADVVSAFHDYLDRFNDGRPFLLLGHSQGATVLTGLVQTEIDGNAALRAQLVSAMLIGGAVTLAPGSTTQGTFQNVPPCRAATQTGCVIAYNTYASTPPATSLFGRTVDGRTVVCTNPAALPGGSGMLDPIVPVPSRAGVADVVGFVSYPASVRAECRSDSRSTWLQAARSPGSQLPDVALAASLPPAWGLHRVDVTIALGDLISVAQQQARSMP